MNHLDGVPEKYTNMEMRATRMARRVCARGITLSTDLQCLQRIYAAGLQQAAAIGSRVVCVRVEPVLRECYSVHMS